MLNIRIKLIWKFLTALLSKEESINLKIKFLFFFIISIFIVACSGPKGDIPLAKVGNNTLYYSDLKVDIPDGVSAQDSVEIVKNLVQNWIMNELMATEADDYLEKNEKDFSKQIEDYKKSLLIFEFEKKWVLEHIDTNISDSEIQKYYQSNQSQFELKTSILKLKFIKVSKTQKENIKQQAKRLLFESNNKNLIEKFCEDYADNFFLDDSVWLVYDDIVKEIPISEVLPKDAVTNNKKIEVSDNQFDYFVFVKEVKIENQVSPANFENENIKKILIQKRKNQLLDSLYQNIYTKASNSGSYTIY